jgi:hypothetical protein
LAAHSAKKHDWQHILGNNMIDSTFWENYEWQYILGKNMSGTTFWENMIGTTF